MVPLGSTFSRNRVRVQNTYKLQAIINVFWLGSALVPLGSTSPSMHKCVFRSRLSAIWFCPGLGSTCFSHSQEIGCVYRTHTNCKHLLTFSGLVPLGSAWFHQPKHASMCVPFEGVCNLLCFGAWLLSLDRLHLLRAGALAGHFSYPFFRPHIEG